MSSNYLDIIRPGINTTFQDKGRDHLYHIGIPFSGAMDNRNYLIANKLVNNNLDSAVIEFAYQGPHIKYSGEKINCAISGDVIFSIKKKDTEIEGKCYESYQIENGDEINIISTNKSVYGYLALGGEFDLKFQWNSCSINTKANIGSNDGKKLDVGQRINFKKINSNKYLKKILQKYNKDTDEVWSSITTNQGSVSHLNFLTANEKDTFKTAFEIDQRWIVELGADRTPHISQAQSVNIFVPADIHKKELHDIHFQAWKKGLKSLYYCRSKSIQRAENVNNGSSTDVTKNVYSGKQESNNESNNYEECLSCQ